MEYRLMKEREQMDLMLLQVKQYVNTEGVEVDDNIRGNIVEEFFEKFWRRKMAYNSRKREQVVETTVEIANSKVGVAYTIGKIAYDLKDECEPYRRMVMETVDKILVKLGASDIDSSIGEVLMEGIIYAFREQTTDYNDDVILKGFCGVLNALHRDIVRPYLGQIYLTMKSLTEEKNTKPAKVRQEAANLCAQVMWECQEEELKEELLSEFPHLIL